MGFEDGAGAANGAGGACYSLKHSWFRLCRADRNIRATTPARQARRRFSAYVSARRRHQAPPAFSRALARAMVAPPDFAPGQRKRPMGRMSRPDAADSSSRRRTCKRSGAGTESGTQVFSTGLWITRRVGVICANLHNSAGRRRSRPILFLRGTTSRGERGANATRADASSARLGQV